MSDRSARHHDLEPLVEQLVSDGLSSDERQQLAELLATDADARRRYLELLHVHSMLAEEFGEAIDPLPTAEADPCVADTTDAPQPSLTLGRRRAWFSRHITRTSIAITAAIFLAVGSFLAFVSAPKFGTDTQPADTAPFVAQIVDEYELGWQDEPPQAKRLRAGTRLAIASGLVEVLYDTGARVVLEGPAEFYVGGKNENTTELSVTNTQRTNSGYLAAGRLTATVTAQEAHGFAVHTPTATFVDFGTEFEVDVSGERDAELIVLDGEVECVRSDEQGKVQRVRVSKGESIRVVDGARELAKQVASEHEMRDARTWRKQIVYQLQNAPAISRRTIAAATFGNCRFDGNRATDISWVTFGMREPGDLVCAEEDGDGVTELKGYFNTLATTNYLVPRLNIEKESPWSVSLPVESTDADVRLASVSLTYRHFNVDGLPQDERAPRGATWTARVVDADERLVARATATTPADPRNRGVAELAFDEPLRLQPGESYTLKISVAGTEERGNHTGIGRLLLLRDIPEDSPTTQQ